MRIEFLNWDRYQPRKDIKNPTWFRINNDLFYDPKLFGISSNNLRVLMYLLCEASRNNNGVITVNFEHLHRIGEIDKKTFNRAIEYLVEKHIVKVRSVRGTYTSLRITGTTEQDITEQDITKHNKTPSKTSFDEVYELYPRKIGKKAGEEKYKKSIKTTDQVSQILMAVKNYSNHCKKSKSDAKYIKHFSTWMNTWEDWIEPPDERNYNKTSEDYLI